MPDIHQTSYRQSLLKTLSNKTALAATALLLTSCIFGCTTRPTGVAPYNRQVDALFQSATIVPDHTYYFFGSENDPDAVIVIDNRYRLQTNRVWARAEVSEKQLQRWAFMARTYEGDLACPYRGVVLRGPDEQQVGMGYSRWTFTAITYPEPGVVAVSEPIPLGTCRDQKRTDDM
ncbi:hypothetical protein [Desulfolithobacter sp.]